MNTAYLTKANNLYALSTRYHPRMVEIARQIPGLSFDKPSRRWVGYADGIAVLVRRLTEDKIAKVTNANILPAKCSEAVIPSTYAKLKDELKRDYQVSGVHFLATQAKEGALLADATGLGKTKQALVAVREFLKYPAVIVCPAYLKRVWVAEGVKCGVDVFPLGGTSPPDTGHISEEDGVVVLNYDILYAWLPYLLRAKNVIFDECQFLIGEKSRRSSAARDLAGNATNVIGLSATPFTNNTKQLFNVVDTLSRGRFGKKFYSYGIRYCDGHTKQIEFESGETRDVYDWSGSSHLDELNERLRYFSLRRTKADVKLEIPAKTRQVIEVEIPLEALDESWTSWVQGGMKTKAVRALNKSARAKVPATVELVLARLQEGSSVILFCYQKNIAGLLEEALKQKGESPFLATGDDTVERRLKSAAAARTQTEGGVPSVLIATIDAMGAGVDLSYADITVFAELHLSPMLLVQAEGRSDRYGQKRVMTIYYMVGIGVGSLDEYIRERVLAKLDNFEQTVGSMGDRLTEDLRGDEEAVLNELREMLLGKGEEVHATATAREALTGKTGK